MHLKGVSVEPRISSQEHGLCILQLSPVTGYRGGWKSRVRSQRLILFHAKMSTEIISPVQQIEKANKMHNQKREGLLYDILHLHIFEKLISALNNQSPGEDGKRITSPPQTLLHFSEKRNFILMLSTLNLLSKRLKSTKGC